MGVDPSALSSQLCDGIGNCAAVDSTCGTFVCADANSCLDECTDNSNCVGASVCAVPNCTDSKIDGESCLNGFECDSGNCVDGVCCENACDGTCERCDNSGFEGTCLAAPDDTDPDLECGVCQVCVSGACDTESFGEDFKDECPTGLDGECSTTGVCDGSGACEMRGGGYQCGDSCIDGELAAMFCDGISMGGCNQYGAYATCTGNY